MKGTAGALASSSFKSDTMPVAEADKVEDKTQSEPVVSVHQAAKALDEKVMEAQQKIVEPAVMTLSNVDVAKKAVPVKKAVPEKKVLPEKKAAPEKDITVVTKKAALETENVTPETEKPVPEKPAPEKSAPEKSAPEPENSMPALEKSTPALEKPSPETPQPTETGTKFEWAATPAQSVYLVGEFNEWDMSAAPMTAKNGAFSVTLPLKGGKHKYKFVVDGEWCYDITKASEADESGNINNVVTVE